MTESYFLENSHRLLWVDTDNRHIISMKSRGFPQTPQDIMAEYNGCSVPQYTAYRRVSCLFRYTLDESTTKTKGVSHNDFEVRFYRFVNNILILIRQIRDTVEVAAQSKTCEVNRLQHLAT